MVPERYYVIALYGTKKVLYSSIFPEKVLKKYHITAAFKDLCTKMVPQNYISKKNWYQNGTSDKGGAYGKMFNGNNQSGSHPDR